MTAFVWLGGAVLICAWQAWRWRRSSAQQEGQQEGQQEAECNRLRAENERLRLHFEANQDGLFDADLITGTVIHAGAWHEMLGLDPGDQQPDRWGESLHPEDRERVKQALADYLARRHEVYRLEYRLRHAEGHYIWVVARAITVWDAEGRPVRLVGSHRDISQRKVSEHTLVAERAQFQAFMDHNPALVCIKDPEGRVLYANGAFERALQCERQQWSDVSLDHLLPAESVAKLKEHDARALASPEPMKGLIQFPGRDGILGTYDATKFRFRNAAGETLLGMMATDCTAQVAAEAQARQSETRYREFFDANPVPTWIADLETGRILTVNETAVAAYGWSRDEFLGLHLADIVVEGSQDVEHPAVCRHRDRHGQERWVQHASHETRHQGRPVRLEMLEDVSDRVALEARIQMDYAKLESLVTQRTLELAEGQARWRMLVDFLPQMVWTTSPDGRCDYVSQQWVDYTGCQMADHLDFGWVDAVHPDDREHSARTWNVAVLSRSTMDLRYRVRSAIGEYRWFAVRALPLLDAAGEIRLWLGTSTDIHDQKLSADNLERAVAERTVELAEARSRAENASRAKGDFLAMMSHEIRTPMNGVVGMTALLLDTPLTDDQRLMVNTIRTSGDALLTVINDILDFSKIEAGKLEIEATPFDLHTMMDEAYETVAAIATAKGVALSFDIDPAVPLDLVGDPTRVRQVLLNLVSNAVKFTAQGSVTVSVTCQGTHDEVAFLRWAVRDSGMGLTAEQLDRLFVPFSQAQLSTTRNFGGTGLGLSISKRLVELMGGTIGAASQPGAGSTFWFNIGMKVHPEPYRLPKGSGPVILVGRQPNAAVRSYLERAGGTVEEFAGDLADFPHWVGRLSCHAAALLIDAGAMDDPATLRRWRSLLPGTPVIVLGSPHDWSACSPLGALGPLTEGTSDDLQLDTRFVPKPIRRADLLRSLLTPSRPEDAASPPAKKASAGRILVADDNPTNQLVARLMLEKLGWVVDIAVDGRQACDAAGERTYALILMDCQMPEMDGLEATRLIRATETTRRTPIIALSAATMAEEREKCYAVGMDDFIAKPISRRQLELTLERWTALAPVL